jgi:hypothetical protein
MGTLTFTDDTARIQHAVSANLPYGCERFHPQNLCSFPCAYRVQCPRP